MLLSCCLRHLSIIVLRCFIYLLYLYPCLHLGLFVLYLRQSIKLRGKSTTPSTSKQELFVTSVNVVNYCHKEIYHWCFRGPRYASETSYHRRFGGNFPEGHFSGGQFPLGYVSGGNFPGGSFFWGFFPGGFFPRGIFPDTVKNNLLRLITL